MLDPRLNRIGQISAQGRKVENLACLINVDSLRHIHRCMDGKKATGIDQVDKEAYNENLEENLNSLVNRMKNMGYYPHPSRRVYIDKPGSNKKRPLGISCYEDKLVEKAVAEILTAVYEPKFMDFSYGFRPGRSCHQAISEVVSHIQCLTSYVVEADIRSFFDTLDHDWLMKMLEHDIADKRFLEIVRRFLKAGIMENGKFIEAESGSPQGNGASPVLANVYLHYVLDLWFEKAVKPHCKGEAYLCRYADDFVCTFQWKEDAERFYEALPKRFAKFGLSLADEKTRIIEFGRFADENRKRRGEGKPQTFDFLGFTFYCSVSSKGTFLVKLKSSRKKVTSKLKKLSAWLKSNRDMKVSAMIMKLNRALVGYYNYYCVASNVHNVKVFLYQVECLLFKWLNRRSQKRSYTWSQFNELLKSCPLVEPACKVNIYVVH